MIWLLRSKRPQQPVVAVSHVTQAMENVQRRNLEEPYFKKDKPYLQGNFQHDNKGAMQCYTVFYAIFWKS